MAANIKVLVMLQMILVFSLHFTHVENHSPAVAAIVQVPSPSPQPSATHIPLYGYTPGSLRPQECGGRCKMRCSKTQYMKPCLFFCNKCCATCLCVPPGTFGNKQFCPCYDHWKTKRGGPKCP